MAAQIRSFCRKKAAEIKKHSSTDMWILRLMSVFFLIRHSKTYVIQAVLLQK